MKLPPADIKKPFLPTPAVTSRPSVERSFEAMVRALKKGRPGLLIKLANHFTSEQLRTLARLPFEVACIALSDDKYIVRGDRHSVNLPASARLIFHSHNSTNEADIFPSGWDFVSFRTHEPTAVISGLGLAFVQPTGYWSNNSFEPFKHELLNALAGDRHRIVAGTVFFQANYAERQLSVVLVPWEFIIDNGRLPQFGRADFMALLPATIEEQMANLALASNTEKQAVRDDWALTSRSGELLHPDQVNCKTGRFELIILEKRSRK